MRRPSFRFGSLVFALGAAVALLAPGAGASFVIWHPPVLIGYTGGDDWEPSVASDSDGEVYVVWAHFGGVPGCLQCGSPAAMVEISRNGGQSFGAPTPLFPSSLQQVDLNVKTNATGAVFVTYLAGADTVLQRSLDEGRSWSKTILANVGLDGSTDKPGLVVQGPAVYVAFDINGHGYVARSHDGGGSFALTEIETTGLNLGFSLNSGGSVAPDGTVYFAWNGVHHSSTTLTPQDSYLTRSSDGGRTWTVLPVQRGLPAGPACPQSCGWDYLGPQMAVGVDPAGTVYVAYNAGTLDGGAPTLWFQSSSSRGVTWNVPHALNPDPAPAWHVFPAIDTGSKGEVFVAWMDNHTGAYNVWFRGSLDGGKSWSPEVQLSAFRSGFSYVSHHGFAFPYGDYFILYADAHDQLNLAWGEGPNWTGPGNVLYTRIHLAD